MAALLFTTDFVAGSGFADDRVVVFYKNLEFPLEFRTPVDEFGYPETQEDYMNRKYSENPIKFLELLIKFLNEKTGPNDFAKVKGVMNNDLLDLKN